MLELHIYIMERFCASTFNLFVLLCGAAVCLVDAQADKLVDALSYANSTSLIFLGEVAWDEARQRCRNINMDLAKMETREYSELLSTKILKVISSPPIQCWVNGKKEGNMWSYTDASAMVQIDSDGKSLWNDGEPNNVGNNSNCIELNGSGGINDHDCSAKRRYICQDKDAQCPRCMDSHAEKAVDIVFLVDGSESITEANFQKLLDWVIDTTDQFNPAGRIEGMDVFVVQYSTTVMLEVRRLIQTKSDNMAFKNSVKNIKQMESGTQLYNALRYVNEEVFPLLVKRKAFKLLVTITDGKSNDEYQSSLIETARNNFNVMVAVGVGDRVNYTELLHFSHRSDFINETDFLNLQGTIAAIEYATYKDCYELQAWCGPATDQTLTVYYLPCEGKDEHTPIKNYTVRISSSGKGQDYVTTSHDETTTTFKGLSPSTEYNVTVAAVYVSVVPVTVTCRTSDYIEIIPKCGNNTNTTLSISFNVIPTDNLSSVIENFRVDILPKGNGINTLYLKSNERIASFSELRPNTLYNVTITATISNKSEAFVVTKAVSLNCPTDVGAECEQKLINLVFLVDGSESISSEDFDKSLEYIRNTVNQLEPKKRRDGIKVEVVQYSETTKNEFSKVVRENADDISDDINVIKQIRQGTKPYFALKEINNIPINSSLYNVLITFGDGSTKSDDERDENEINEARKNYDVMLAVRVGEEPNDDVLKDFVHNHTLVNLEDCVLPKNITDNILDFSHEDCIEFNLNCNCQNATDKTLWVTYHYSLRGKLTNGKDIINKFIITANGEQYTKDVTVHNLNIKGLESNKQYLVTVTGDVSKSFRGKVVANSTNCATQERVKPNLECGLSTDTTVSAEVNLHERTHRFEIMPGGTGQNVKTASRTVFFTSLNPSTDYKIKATPIVGDCEIADSQNRTCPTKARTTLNITCGYSSCFSLNVSLSGSSTDPGGFNSLFNSYRLSVSPGDYQKTVAVTSQTMKLEELTPSTRYTINLEVTPSTGNEVVFSDSVVCTTQDCIVIDPFCKYVTNTTLTVEYTLVPNIPEVFNEYRISITQAGETPEFSTSADRSAYFSNLNSSTYYTITVSANATDRAYDCVKSGSVTCFTGDPTPPPSCSDCSDCCDCSVPIILLGVLLGLAILVIICLVIFVVWKKRKQDHEKAN